MGRIRVNKNWVLLLIGVISFLALFIILFGILAPEKESSLSYFLRNMATSVPFAILIAVVDYRLVIFINHTKWLVRRSFLRIVIESIAIIILAIIFVAGGNFVLFFMQGGDWLGYFSTTTFYVSATAATMINIFTVTFIEFFVQLKRNHTLQKENLKIQYQQLKNQINPHFLFNSLNTITSLIRKDSEQAVVYIQKLSHIYRYVLSQDAKELIYVADEVEFIKTYVNVLRIRYGDTLLYNIEISDVALEQLIPPMSLQLLVENAVKHNAVSQKRPLIINIKSKGDYLVVSNNIIPRITVEKSAGVGLKNLEKKYQIISQQGIKIINNENEFNVILPLL